MMKSIRELKAENLAGKKVFVRVDFNVPIDKGEIADTFRIDTSLPTLKYLAEAGAELTIATHLGNKEDSLDRVIAYVKDKLPDFNLKFLPNLRLNPGEEKNDEDFARDLASGMDIYVNEAFSVCHREHASIVSLPDLLPAYAGFVLEKEVAELSKAFKPERPFVVVLGGLKFGTKLPLIEKFVSLADSVFVGGALCNSFFKRMNYEIGNSAVDEDAEGLEELLSYQNLILPTDVEVAVDDSSRNADSKDVKADERIVDIGVDSIEKISSEIKKAKMVLWNGNIGFTEGGFDKGTRAVAEAVIDSDAYSIVGGGNTIDALNELGISLDKINFVSTGGGAMLEFLAKGTLPGLEALGFKTM